MKDTSQRTLAHYQRSAEAFEAGTRDHDVSQNVQALLRYLPERPGLAILDFGCGPGRDLRTFKALGHVPVGLDGCAAFVEKARQSSGCEVWLQDFLALDLPTERFEGIFANASLFHVPATELPRVLGQLRASLKPGGVLFSSNPRGHNEEGWQGERYGVWYDWSRWHSLLHSAGFEALEHYYRPAGLPRDQQHWLASVWRKA